MIPISTVTKYNSLNCLVKLYTRRKLEGTKIFPIFVLTLVYVYIYMCVCVCVSVCVCVCLCMCVCVCVCVCTIS